LAGDNRAATVHTLAAMDPNKSALERAFELAKSGAVKSVADLRAKVSREGYSASQLDGAALGRQLRNLINKANET
jgi:hypothetical protein